MTEQENYFVAPDGTRLELRRVSRLWLSEVQTAARVTYTREHGPVPPVPTYEIETFGGDKEIHEHDEITIVEDRYKDDADLHARWSAYINAKEALDSHALTASWRAQIDRGVLTPPPDYWLEQRAYYNLPEIEDPRKLKFAYIMDVFEGWRGIANLIAYMSLLPDPVEVAAAATADAFRRQMGKPRRRDAGADKREAEK